MDDFLNLVQEIADTFTKGAKAVFAIAFTGGVAAAGLWVIANYDLWP